MISPSINAIPNSKRSRAIATLSMAFSTDPVMRWLYPEPHQYLTQFPKFVRLFAGDTFGQGSAFYADDFAAIALWLAPGGQPDEEALVAHLQQSVAEHKHDQVFGVLEQMGGYHPEGPVWYLPAIGVDPHLQGRGYGSALLAHTLARCDSEKKPAYLESSNERNIPLYERHGFEVLATIQVKNSPPVWPMLRKPR